MKAAEKIKVRRIVMYRGHNTDTVIAKASKVPARLAWLVVKGKTKRAWNDNLFIFGTGVPLVDERYHSWDDIILVSKSA